MGFSKHVKRVKSKAVAKVAALSSHLRKLSQSIDSALLVINAQIRPILTYGLHLLAPYLDATSLKHLDVAKNRFLKKTLSLPPTTSTELIHRACGTKRFAMELYNKSY